MNTTHSIEVTGFSTPPPSGAAKRASSLLARIRTLALALPIRAPRPLRPRTAAEEAAAVRELALRVQATDPSYASDLLAAADLHEERYEAAGGRR